MFAPERFGTELLKSAAARAFHQHQTLLHIVFFFAAGQTTCFLLGKAHSQDRTIAHW